MEVVYKLWEGSWDDDAFVCDVEGDVLIDPNRVREIHHEGRYYDVLGPHICDPSPQRTPVIYQAGSSDRGIDFGAKHGEALFTIFPNVEVCAEYTERYRERMNAHGRDAGNAKILMGLAVVTAETEEEAKRKHAEMLRQSSPEGAFALFGGWTGIDLSQFKPTDQLDKVEGDQMQFLADYFTSVDSTRTWTVAEMTEFLKVASLWPVLVGTPEQVTDELERWHVDGGVDGFNLCGIHTPASYDDFVDMIVPELQKRGLFRKRYEGKTLREHYFGPGQQRLAEDHIGSSFRPLGAQP
jgi:FMN-dependent oxidoreductase (nitrilotriacetate monooxygenase family)